MKKLLDNLAKCSRLYHSFNSHLPYCLIFIYCLTFVLTFLISTNANANASASVDVGSLKINRPNNSSLTKEESPAPAQSEILLFTFVQVSDTHISDNWHGPENKYNNALNDFVNTINSQTNHPKPGFVIFTGDNIEGALRTITEGCGNDKKVAGTTAEAFQDFKSIADGLQAPYYLLTHNHDTMSHREHWYDENSSRSSKCEWGKIEHDNGAGYIEVFGSEPYNGTTGDKFNYYWTQGSFLFVVQGVKHGGNPDNNWLNDVLKTNKDKKVFYFTHANAIYSRDDKGPNSNLGCECSSCSTFYLKKNGTLINTLKTHGNVLISFAGHDHMTSAGQHKNGERFLSSSDHLTFDSPDDMIYTTVAANFEGGVYKICRSLF